MQPNTPWAEEAPARLTLTVSVPRCSRWREAARAAEDDISDWALNRYREFLGMRRFTPTAATLKVALAAAALAQERVPSGQSEDKILPGWARLLRALGNGHRELCVELGRFAEAVVNEFEMFVDPDPSTITSRFANVLTSMQAEAIVVPMDDEELVEIRQDCTHWGFDKPEEWLAACIDTMVDHEDIPWGLRDAVLRSHDDRADAAILKGLIKELDLWESAPQYDKPALAQHLESTARWARLVLLARGRRTGAAATDDPFGFASMTIRD